MKVHFIVISALLLLTGCGEQGQANHPSPPRTLIFDSAGDFTTSQEAAAMPEAELNALIRENSWEMNGIENREDMVYIAEKLEACPLPFVEGGKLDYVLYYPDSEEISISYKSDDTRITFGIDLDPASSEKYVRKHIAPNISGLIREDPESDTKIYSLDIGDEEQKFIPFLVETDGIYITARVFSTEETACGLMENSLSFIDMAILAADESLWLEDE